LAWKKPGQEIMESVNDHRQLGDPYAEIPYMYKELMDAWRRI
jgi:hypothetical protein